MTSGQSLLGWHFLPEDGFTRFSPRTKVEPGQTLTVNPPLEFCRRGLHASVRAVDALRYAPGPLVCRVELSGEMLNECTKVCAQHRKVLWMADATKVLHLFACDEAERVFQRANVTDPRYIAAIETKRRWVEGKATTEELEASRSVALTAIRSAIDVTSLATALSATLPDVLPAACCVAYYVVPSAANARLTAALMQLQPGETS